MFFRDDRVYTEKTFSAVEAMIDDAALWTRCLEGRLGRWMKTPFVNWDATPDLAQATWEWPERNPRPPAQVGFGFRSVEEFAEGVPTELVRLT